jgi:hypothetical protein
MKYGRKQGPEGIRSDDDQVALISVAGSNILHNIF